jgi:spore germination protein KC
MAYIIALGFDKGKQDRLMLTVQYVTFMETGGEDKELGQVDKTLVVSVEAPSLYTGLDMLSISTSRRFNLMHAKYLIFSKELAESPLMEYYMNAITRYPEIRRIMYFMIARQGARNFILENRSLIGESSYKSIELMIRQAQNTGFFPMIDLRKFYDGIKSTYHQPVAILVGNNFFNTFQQANMNQEKMPVTGGEYLAGEMPRTGGLKVEATGAAVFRGAQMVGELTGDENRLLLMVQGELKGGFFTIPDPKNEQYIVALDVKLSRKPRIYMDVSQERPKVSIEIPLEGDILSIQSKTNYESAPLKLQLEKAFEKRIKAGLDGLINKCQQEFKADIFGFGWYAARHFGTIQEWESYNWHERFPDAEIYTSVKFHIRRFGTMIKTSPAK